MTEKKFFQTKNTPEINPRCFFIVNKSCIYSSLPAEALTKVEAKAGYFLLIISPP
jgi:hypothetical protein